MTRTLVVDELSHIAQSDISNYLELVDGRLVVTDPATLPKEALSAIKSIKEHVTDRGHRTIVVELWDKVAALALLARATGLHVSRAEVSTDINVTVEDKTEANARVMARIDALAARLPAPTELPMLIDITPNKEIAHD